MQIFVVAVSDEIPLKRSSVETAVCQLVPTGHSSSVSVMEAEDYAFRVLAHLMAAYKKTFEDTKRRIRSGGKLW